MPVSISTRAMVRRGVESFDLTINSTTGDRCDYGLLAHCTDTRTGEHYVASCPSSEDTPEVFLFQPLNPSCVGTEEVQFDDEPEEPESDDDPEGAGEDGEEGEEEEDELDPLDHDSRDPDAA